MILWFNLYLNCLWFVCGEIFSFSFGSVYIGVIVNIVDNDARISFNGYNAS